MLPSPVRIRKRSVAQFDGVVASLLVRGAVALPFSELAWMAKGRSLTWGRSKGKLDCGNRRRKKICLRSSCRVTSHFENERGRNCSSQCSSPDYGR